MQIVKGHVSERISVDQIRFRISKLFRKHQHLTGTKQTKRALEKGYKWLNIFQLAQAGDIKWQRVLQRYDRAIASKVEQARLNKMLDAELEWQQRLKNRPIFTGTIIRSTPFNRPLLRMKPQHPSISGMITKRMKTKERRFEKLNELAEYKDMVIKEKEFEQRLLGPNAKVWAGEAIRDWLTPISQNAKALHAKLHETLDKFMAPYPEELIRKAKEARKNKVMNKTNERERERRGEILNSTMKRTRTGLPAHLLAKLSEEEIKEELIVRRSRSEVGYVGHLKKRKGYKLKTPKHGPEGKTWSVIDGAWSSEEDAQRLLDSYKEITKANQSRRQTDGPVDGVEKS
ncbi:hypothetical protein VNI00_001091 [Paramarasmius palmivorus]|uniref:Uncharacterized protein n=1 Tax=Paramarasmius palmivorus TaxID=297713 RepID=A0AAW0E7W8_9AGAR